MRFGLNAAVAGVAPSVIARAVGSHSANVLQIYRKCVTGQDVGRQARRGSVGAHGVRKRSGRSMAETFRAHSRRSAVDICPDPITAGPHEGPLTGVLAGQRPFAHVVAGEGFEPSKLSRWIYSPGRTAR